MDHDIAYSTQSSSPSQPIPPCVATYLICQNTLLRTGISRILHGSRFEMAEGPVDRRSVPDLILLCDRPTQQGSAETIKQLKTQYPGARLVALSDNLDLCAVQDFRNAGLDGLCPTGISQAALRNVLELVMLGELYLPTSVSLALLDHATCQSRPLPPTAYNPVGPAGKFSEREAQILQCLTRGASNKLIARELGLAEATVKVHIKAILRKAKAANRTQAAMWASQYFSANSPDVAIAG